jgi:hypothetical protein
MKSLHTPLPWKAVGNPLVDELDSVAANEMNIESGDEYTTICTLAGGIPLCEHEANWHLIVRAVNNHESLLEACQMLLIRLETMPGLPKGSVYDFARAAIAKATGGAK